MAHDAKESRKETIVALEHAASIADLRRRARRRVPRFAFDFVDGGAEGEDGLRRNEAAFANIQLLPRYLVDVSTRKLETTLFGRTYGAPFGVAPMGLLNLMWPGTDLALARLAARERIPYGASTNASTMLETLAEAAEGHAWLQLYIADDTAMTDDLIARGKAAGMEVMLLTVDVPVPAKRDRDLRNAFKVPFRMTPGVIAELMRRPAWSLATRTAGPPNLENLIRYRQGADVQELAKFQAAVITGRFTWDDLKRLRDRWPGKLVVKGIQAPEDAVRCVEAGCDGIMVSNHGGRQAAFAPASIESLPAVATAAGAKVPLLIDSGLRRGEDVARARALGATMALLGRPFAYGAGAGGDQGVRRAFAIIHQELDRALGQLGVPDIADVGRSILADRPEAKAPVPKRRKAKASDGL